MPPRRSRRINVGNQLRIRGKLLVDVELKGYNIKVPYDFINDIMDSTNDNEIAVFNIAKTGVLVSIADYTHQKSVIYVSSEVFALVKHKRTPKTKFITIEKFTDYKKGESVLLEPLSIKFFDVKDQLILLQDYICHNVRLLYPRQEFTVYSTELNTTIPFRVLMTNDTRFQVILAIDTDLTVNFDCSTIEKRMILPEQWREPIPIYVPSDGMKCAIDYVLAGAYSGTKSIDDFGIAKLDNVDVDSINMDKDNVDNYNVDDDTDDNNMNDNDMDNDDVDD